MVGSISSGKTLTLSVNAQMYDTGLTDAVSDYVQNEVQNIIIDSDIIKAGYVRRNTITLSLIIQFKIHYYFCYKSLTYVNLNQTYNGTQAINATNEVQEVYVVGGVDEDLSYRLSFDNVNTSKRTRTFEKNTFFKIKHFFIC